MKDKNSTDSEFDIFMNGENDTPSKQLDDLILSRVKKELLPDKKVVFGKLFLIQLFVGLITMLFCPQFNFSLTNSYELFHYFHYNFGAEACMAICGTIFTGSGAIFASYILNRNELNLIRNTKLLYYLAITSLSIAIFMLLGADIYLKMTSFWFLGATLSGVSLLEINSRIRLQIFSQ